MARVYELHGIHPCEMHAIRPPDDRGRATIGAWAPAATPRSGRHAALRPPRRAPAATPRSGRHAALRPPRRAVPGTRAGDLTERIFSYTLISGCEEAGDGR